MNQKDQIIKDLMNIIEPTSLIKCSIDISPVRTKCRTEVNRHMVKYLETYNVITKEELYQLVDEKLDKPLCYIRDILAERLNNSLTKEKGEK